MSEQQYSIFLGDVIREVKHKTIIKQDIGFFCKYEMVYGVEVGTAIGEELTATLAWVNLSPTQQNILDSLLSRDREGFKNELVGERQEDGLQKIYFNKKNEKIAYVKDFFTTVFASLTSSRRIHNVYAPADEGMEPETISFYDDEIKLANNERRIKEVILHFCILIKNYATKDQLIMLQEELDAEQPSALIVMLAEHRSTVFNEGATAYRHSLEESIELRTDGEHSI